MRLRSIPARAATFECFFEVIELDILIHPNANLVNSANPL